RPGTHRMQSTIKRLQCFNRSVRCRAHGCQSIERLECLLQMSLEGTNARAQGPHGGFQAPKRFRTETRLICRRRFDFDQAPDLSNVLGDPGLKTRQCVVEPLFYESRRYLHLLKSLSQVFDFLNDTSTGRAELTTMRDHGI